MKLSDVERQHQIEEVMQEFDFAAVRKAMVALEWSYSSTHGRVPTVKALKRTALLCLNGVHASRVSNYYHTGGFEAFWHRAGMLGLRFVVREWEVQ